MKRQKLIFGILIGSFFTAFMALSNLNKTYLKIFPQYLHSLCESRKEGIEALNNLCDAANIEINDSFDEYSALKFVETTQKQFFNRQPKQERWEKSPLEWIDRNSDRVSSALKTLGFFDSVLPEKTEYDAICILGAAGPTMQNRIKFVEQLVKNGLTTQRIVLLTGERYLTENIDGTAQELADLGRHFGIENQKLTETHLFKYLYEKSGLNGKFKLIVIDIPQKNGCRPTTQTTLEKFLEWQKNNSDVNNVLFISNQPSVKYQQAVIAEVIYYYKSKLNFEVVGEEYKNINLQRAVGELGAYIWAVMPRILRGKDINANKDFIGLAKKLYGHQPIFYNDILNSRAKLS